MYETKQETTGLRGGFGHSKPPQRIECVSASVLYDGQRSRASLQREGARARRQTRTGYRQNLHSNDDEILAGKPKVIRWFVYIFAALCLCGIVPMAAAEWLIWFCDSFGCWWLPFMDGNGQEHTYAINNTDTPLLSRWLLERHPDLNIETRKSIYDTKKEG